MRTGAECSLLVGQQLLKKGATAGLPSSAGAKRQFTLLDEPGTDRRLVDGTRRVPSLHGTARSPFPTGDYRFRVSKPFRLRGAARRCCNAAWDARACDRRWRTRSGGFLCLLRLEAALDFRVDGRIEAFEIATAEALQLFQIRVHRVFPLLSHQMKGSKSAD